MRKSWKDINVVVKAEVDLMQLSRVISERLDHVQLSELLQRVAEMKHPGYSFLAVLAPLILQSYEKRVWRKVQELGGPEAIIQVALEQGFLSDEEKENHPNKEAWELDGQEFVHYIDAIDMIKQIKEMFERLDVLLTGRGW